MIDAAEIAKQLILAEQERRAIAPFTHLNPELDTDTAYAAQRIVVQARLDNGERIIGAKLGLTSRVKQKAMGVDSPLFGRGDRPHDCTLRRADSVGRVDSSASRARDRVRAGP